MTGDALHGWTPFMGDSYPYEWITTLDAAEKLDFNLVLGGHGDVMHGKLRFELWKEYFQDLMDRTAAAYAEGASLDAKPTKPSSAFLTREIRRPIRSQLPQIRNRQRNQGLPSNRLPAVKQEISLDCYVSNMRHYHCEAGDLPSRGQSRDSPVSNRSAP